MKTVGVEEFCEYDASSSSSDDIFVGGSSRAKQAHLDRRQMPNAPLFFSREDSLPIRGRKLG